MYEHVANDKHSPARRLADETFTELSNALKDEYKFYTQLVGSGVKGTIIRDADGRYDLDYQIILTHNSKVFKKNGKFDPTQTKKRFMGEIQKILKSSRLEDSTTAITLNDLDKDYSIDFVIIDGTDDKNWKIVRRNNKGSNNEYTWNEMSEIQGYSQYYGSLEELERLKLANKIMDLKVKDKKLLEDRRTGSYVLTMQAIKEHKDRHEHKG